MNWRSRSGIGLFAGSAALTGLAATVIAPYLVEMLIFLVAVASGWLLWVTTAAPRTRMVFTPGGLMVSFLILNVGVMPIFWATGLVESWDEIRDSPLSAAGFTLIALIFLVLGLLIGAPRPVRSTTVLRTPSGRLSITLLVGLFTGLIGYLGIAVSVGGPMALLFSLADRRDSLAGTGSLRILMVATAVTCIIGILHRGKTPLQVVLTWICGLSYCMTTLATGSRFQALVLVIAVVVAAVRTGQIGSRVWVWVAFGSLIFVPLSTFYGLEVRTGLTYRTNVVVVDSSSFSNALSSLVGPFARGGLDVIRTTGVLSGAVGAFELRPELLLGSIANLVPRPLWPGKPEGSSTQFSALYFPERWQNGTGVPPSMFAELIYTFGSVGGVIAIVAVGVAVAQVTGWLNHAARSIFWVIATPLLAADCIQLAKSGSDGFLRTFVIHAAGILIMVFVSRIVGTTATGFPPKELSGADLESYHEVVARDKVKTTSDAPSTGVPPTAPALPPRPRQAAPPG